MRSNSARSLSGAGDGWFRTSKASVRTVGSACSRSMALRPGGTALRAMVPAATNCRKSRLPSGRLVKSVCAAGCASPGMAAYVAATRGAMAGSSYSNNAVSAAFRSSADFADTASSSSTGTDPGSFTSPNTRTHCSRSAASACSSPAILSASAIASGSCSRTRRCREASPVRASTFTNSSGSGGTPRPWKAASKPRISA